MRILAVDDEKIALEVLVEAIQKAEPKAEVCAFRNALDAVDFVSKNPVEIAFLDISMRELSGVKVAELLKQRCPSVNIIFSTGYDEYRDVAFDMHASGYLTKPITAEKVKKELMDLRHPLDKNGNVQARPCIIKASCYGNFDAYTMEGEPIYFERQKAKELFAYLVFRHGASCTVKELAAVIFEDAEYDRKTQIYLQKIISSMMQSLRAIGAEEIINKKFNCLGVVADLIDCDYYRALSTGDKTGYFGEFMSQYSWAEEANWYFMSK